jgi:hypothetical protein
MDKLKQQDKIWSECSTLDQGNLAYAMQLRLQQKQPNLKLNTRLKQVLVSPVSTCAPKMRAYKLKPMPHIKH